MTTIKRTFDSLLLIPTEEGNEIAPQSEKVKIHVKKTSILIKKLRENNFITSTLGIFIPTDNKYARSLASDLSTEIPLFKNKRIAAPSLNTRDIINISMEIESLSNFLINEQCANVSTSMVWNITILARKEVIKLIVEELNLGFDLNKIQTYDIYFFNRKNNIIEQVKTT